MENRNCNIVTDLLPNYVEELTSKETNDFISTHLSECKKCQEKYLSMKKNIQVVADNSKDSNKIVGLKKVHRKIVSLKIVIVLVLTISLFVMTYYYFFMRNAYSGVINEMVKIVKAIEDNNLELVYDNNNNISEIRSIN